jgi:hypothetical protein
VLKIGHVTGTGDGLGVWQRQNTSCIRSELLVGFRPLLNWYASRSVSLSEFRGGNEVGRTNQSMNLNSSETRNFGRE